MDLYELAEQVEDSRSFLTFAQALMVDRQTNAQSGEGWENVSIEAFLEAAIAWAHDSHFGVRQGLDPGNPWKQFAAFLYCGKIYE